MFDTLIWWFGALHAGLYLIGGALAAITFATALFSEWLIKRWKIKREMLRAYQRMLEDREKERQP